MPNSVLNVQYQCDFTSRRKIALIINNSIIVLPGKRTTLKCSSFSWQKQLLIHKICQVVYEIKT